MPDPYPPWHITFVMCGPNTSACTLHLECANTLRSAAHCICNVRGLYPLFHITHPRLCELLQLSTAPRTAINPTGPARVTVEFIVTSRLIQKLSFQGDFELTVRHDQFEAMNSMGGTIHWSKKAQMRSLEVCRWPVSAFRLSHWFLYL